jgi:hypothetical protein
MGKKTVKTEKGDKEVVKKETAANSPAVAKAGAAGRKAKRVQEGKVYVNATYNNTVVTVTDTSGNVLAWASAGSLGFAGPKKATPFASSKVIAAITEKIQASGPKDISVIPPFAPLSITVSISFPSKMLHRFRITALARQRSAASNTATID